MATQIVSMKSQRGEQIKTEQFRKQKEKNGNCQGA
jgi:hypothetical protein